MTLLKSTGLVKVHELLNFIIDNNNVLILLIILFIITIGKGNWSDTDGHY